MLGSTNVPETIGRGVCTGWRCDKHLVTAGFAGG